LLFQACVLGVGKITQKVHTTRWNARASIQYLTAQFNCWNNGHPCARNGFAGFGPARGSVVIAKP
jgi:hypothetical protein